MKATMKIWQIFLLFFSNFFLISCGYVLEGSNPTLPEQAKSISIDPIQNQTFEANLENYLTVELKTLIRNNSSVILRNTNQSSDLVLTVLLTKFEKTRANDPESENPRLVFQLHGKISLEDIRTKREVWNSEEISSEVSTTHEDEKLSTSLSGLNITRSRIDVSQEFARKVYEQIFYRF